MRRRESFFQLSSVVREVVRTLSLHMAASTTATTRFRERFAPGAEDGLPGGLLATTRRDADQGGCSE